MREKKTFNDEDFIFTLSAVSHSFITNNVSLLNVPGYKKVGLILIDNAIYNNIKELKRSINFTVSVVGELSGIEDTFTVNLYT